MPLQKQSLPINFASGLDTKTDPFQVSPGKMLLLENTIFNKGGLFQKRNGFAELTNLADNSNTFLTTFNGGLTALGTSLNAYSTASSTWINKATIQPMSMNTLSLVKNNTNQTQCDSAISPNGLVCTVYTDTGVGTTTYNYVITDVATGANIVGPKIIPVASGVVTGSPRVFLLGSYFMIVFNNVISATNHLQYVAINTTVPTSVSGNTDISTQYSPSADVAFDGVTVNNTLYLAWNGSDGGGAVRTTFIDSSLNQHATTAYATATAYNFSLCADVTGNAPVIYVIFRTLNAATTVNVRSFDVGFNPISTLTQRTVTGTNLNLASFAQNGQVTIYCEIANNYSYDSTIPSHYLERIIQLQAGGLVSQGIIARSVGLASKGFILGGVGAVLAVYQSTNQPTYFLLNGSGSVIGKLAYQNAGGYLTAGLPLAAVSHSTASIAYLVKDQVEAVNKIQGAASSSAVYSQLGISLAEFTFGTSSTSSAEIGSNLHLSGGQLLAYDGTQIVEQGFHLFPDNVEATWTAVSTVTPTGTFSSGSTSIVVSSASGISVGMTITDTSNATYIPTGTTITAISGTTLTISKATTHAGAADNLSIQGNIAAKPDGATNTNAYFYQVTYEWSDNDGNIFRSAPSIPIGVTTSGAASTGIITVSVPTLRMTLKSASPVKIVVYRWSVSQQTYYQATSITMPVLNSMTSDSVSFVDTLPDAQIIGNNILYTTGGVLENIGPPATNIMTLFKSRLFLVDAEDANLLWYSKSVLEVTPVEMSDLQTIYVAPTISAQGNTGPVTALFAMDDKLIIFKKDAIYYLAGSGPDVTGANNDFSDPIFITSTVGCANPSSIVFIPQGLMFQSDKGIWLLGRDLSTTYIGAPVEAFNSALVLSALTVPGTNQVRFTLNNRITLMYDYYYTQWGTFVGIPGIFSTLFQGLHTFINASGQVFQESVGSYVDGSSPVLMKFQTGWLSLAGLQGLERAYFFYLLGTYLSPHTLQIQIAYDYQASPAQTVIIQPVNVSSTWGSQPFWGSATTWGGSSSIEEWKIFFTQQQCESFQITITEVFNSSAGFAPGAGFTLSGLNFIYGTKRAYRRTSSGVQAG